MSLEQIYPVLITRNASATIARTLESLSDFPEVIVYDNGSTDDTIEICSQFSNVRVCTGEFIGFGPTKAHAVSLARGDWVFSIDADEYMSKSLLQSLHELDLTDERVAYMVERYNLLMGRHMRRGGWGNDWIVRLFNRQWCQFDDAVVHEKVVVPGDVRLMRTEGPLWHQAITNINQFLIKISRYSELEVNRGKRTFHPAIVLLRACWASFRSYFLKAGFLEGWRGLVLAYCFGIGCFFRYMSRYADQAVPGTEHTNLPE